MRPSLPALRSYARALFALSLSLLVLAGCDSGSDPGDDLGQSPAFSFASSGGATVAEDSTDANGDAMTYTMTVTVSDPGFQNLSVDVVFDEDASSASFDDVSGIEKTTTLTFPENTTDSTSQTLTFQVNDDDQIGEMAEDVVFTLANPTPDQAMVGANAAYTLTVNDDDLTAIPIADARAMDDDATVAVEGVITRVEGSNTRIQDGTGGLVVRDADGQDELATAIQDGDVSLGDRIRAMGTLGTFNGLRQLGGDVRYMVTQEDAGLPDPQTLSLSGVGEDDESELVTVEGLMIEADADTFATDGGDGFGNYTLLDADGNASGVVLRIPGGSFYEGMPIPGGSFTFTGVVGERNGTYKLIAIREGDLHDIESTGPEVLSIADARKTDGQEVTIEGIVTTAGGGDARLQDETAGIFISRNDDFAMSVERGDRVRVTGSVNGYANQRQIDGNNLTDYDILSSGNDLPDAQMLSSLADLGDDYESERVRVEGVTISPDGGDDDSDPDGTFVAGGAGGNYTLTDASDSTRVLRIPAGSFYEGKEIPEGKVTIEGVAGQFFEDFQILARYDGQIMKTGTGGGAQTLLNVTFDDQNDLAPFTQYSVASDSASWFRDSYMGNGYAKVSGFGADEASDDWLISPALDFSSASDETLTFETVKGYGGPPLRVLVSTNYDGTGNPEDADWTDVTDRATLAQDSDEPAGGGFTSFIPSGEVDLSDDAFQSGATYVAFQYVSDGTGSGEAATWEVDDIVLQEQGAGGFPTPPGRPSN